MWDFEFVIDFVWGCFLCIFDLYYKVDIIGIFLLGVIFSDVIFIFCIFIGILKKKIVNMDIFFLLV